MNGDAGDVNDLRDPLLQFVSSTPIFRRTVPEFDRTLVSSESCILNIFSKGILWLEFRSEVWRSRCLGDVQHQAENQGRQAR